MIGQGIYILSVNMESTKLTRMEIQKIEIAVNSPFFFVSSYIDKKNQFLKIIKGII